MLYYKIISIIFITALSKEVLESKILFFTLFRMHFNPPPFIVKGIKFDIHFCFIQGYHPKFRITKVMF